MHPDETTDFWQKRPHDDLAERCAILHRQRRENANEVPQREVAAARRAVSDLFIQGGGVEVGAGPRPFPLPPEASCVYGDTRDAGELAKYFHGRDSSPAGRIIDAQTFNGCADETFDFVISAHVIEHLENPLGSIRHSIRVLKPGGVFILVVPDMRYTFDSRRKPTPLSHVLADDLDGGEGTRMESYIEFIRDVGIPVFGNDTAPDEIEAEASRLAQERHDIHFHAWTTETFSELLRHASASMPFSVVGSTTAVNENIFVLRRATE